LTFSAEPWCPVYRHTILGWFLEHPRIGRLEYPDGSYLFYASPPPSTTWLDLDGLSCRLHEASFGRNLPLQESNQGVSLTQRGTQPLGHHPIQELPVLFRSPVGIRQRDYYASANDDGLQGVKDPYGIVWHDCQAQAWPQCIQSPLGALTK
jgi:hypothetical protein